MEALRVYILKYFPYRIMPMAKMAMQDADSIAMSNSTVGLVREAPLRKSEVKASVT